MTAPAQPHNSDITQEAVLNDLRMLRDDLSLSTELLEQGVKDSLASRIESMRQDPVMGFLDIIKTAEERIWPIVEGFICTYLRGNRELVQNVYKVKNVEHELQYVIVLAKYDLDSKYVIDDFSYAYSRTVLHSRFPVTLHMISTEMVKDLINVETVDIDA